jgi:hypothetical protein
VRSSSTRPSHSRVTAAPRGVERSRLVAGLLACRHQAAPEQPDLGVLARHTLELCVTRRIMGRARAGTTRAFTDFRLDGRSEPWTVVPVQRLQRAVQEVVVGRLDGAVEVELLLRGDHDHRPHRELVAGDDLLRAQHVRLLARRLIGRGGPLERQRMQVRQPRRHLDLVVDVRRMARVDRAPPVRRRQNGHEEPAARHSRDKLLDAELRVALDVEHDGPADRLQEDRQLPRPAVLCGRAPLV